MIHATDRSLRHVVGLVLALLLVAGCSGRDSASGGDGAKVHWTGQEWLKAIDTLQGGQSPEDFAASLGYPLENPDSGWKLDQDSLHSRITMERVQRGANKPTTRVELSLWMGDGTGTTEEHMTRTQEVSDRIERVLRTAWGTPDNTARPTGPQVGTFGNRDQEIWYRGAWTVNFDPAAYRPRLVLSLTFNPNWKPPTSGSGSGNTVDNGSGNNSGSGSGNPGATNSGSGTGTTPPPDAITGNSGSGSSSSLTGMPTGRADDDTFAEAIHNRFVNAASRSGADTLRTRRFRDNGREWLISGATVDGVQVVGGGGARVTWRFDRMETDTRINLYMLVDGKTIPDFIGAAIHCYRLNDVERGDDLVRRVLQGNPTLKPGIDEFLARQRRMRVPEGGFILFHGRTWRFLTPFEMSQMKEAEEIEELCGKLEVALKKLDEVGGPSLAESLVKRLAAKGSDAQGRALDLVLETRDAALKRIGRTQVSSSTVKELKRQLDAAREAAMKAIFDEQAYPYPNPDHKGQAEVDDLVDDVRRLWENPADSVLENTPGLQDKLEEITRLQEFVRILDPASDAAAMNNAEDFRRAVAEMIDLQNMSGNGTESRRYKDFDIVERDNNEGRSDATEAEREFVSILNAYRKMMGVGPLRINDHLTLAARGHSDYMKESGEFAHEIDGHPLGKSPRERASKFKYGGGVGENIYMGSPAAQSAFDGWAHSSGHHRNMLNSTWRVIGAGVAGGHWTTLFGGSDDGSEPKASR